MLPVYALKAAQQGYLSQKVCKVWKRHLHALADQIFLVQALATGISMYPSHWRPAAPHAITRFTVALNNALHNALAFSMKLG